ncbi:inositol polyphosphate 1-phosphatase isoform X1 [Ostrinia furnacalis]|uniref:inositol polyphosphate 1-phosphatase isoform X1 n=1 Tax=Ostrinia furnacalis TaxID=93504 RepID=UPI00103B309F|nr:inositol polyphosphate 1-phosphatase isoform X1 [Ostrinia furnacalis]
MTEILRALINASERAALVARSCCNSDNKNDLLVAEKSDGEANARFEKDYKTIADVLAQECIRKTLVTKFPELTGHVRGEECCEIGGTSIKLADTVDETAELLTSLVHPSLAKRMAVAAHSDTKHPLHYQLPSDLPDVDVSDLGIWIDPIDATAEFIAGINGTAALNKGLQVVTVLIGAYRRSTGEPVIGVINQPFFNSSQGRLLWGICYEGVKRWGGHNVENFDLGTAGIYMSSAEDPLIRKTFMTICNITDAAGAGNKLLGVALGDAIAYILSKSTTFLWDTCGPHAILKARGGDVISFDTHASIQYNVPNSSDPQQFCNAGGIIAYGDSDQCVNSNLRDIKNIILKTLANRK